MQTRDLKLLERLKNGDPSAFKELFDVYYVSLNVYSLKYCDDIQLAEDIVQGLFVKIWDEKLYMKLEGAISPYLFQSVKNNTLQAMNKKSKYHFVDIEDQINTLMDDEKLDMATMEDEKIKLLNEIEALPKKSKEVFKAIVLEDLKYKEVAEQLGISVNTVKTHYARALKHLRISLSVIIMLILV